MPYEDHDAPRMFVVLEDARDDGLILVLDGADRVLYDRVDIISVSDVVQEAQLDRRWNPAEDTVLHAASGQEGRPGHVRGG